MMNWIFPYCLKCLSGNDLLESKKRANRPQDQLDIRFLEKKKKAGFFKEDPCYFGKETEKKKKKDPSESIGISWIS